VTKNQENMVLLKNNDIKVERLNWNMNPTVEDYLDITNHGPINDCVFPWKRLIINIKGNCISPLSDKDKYSLTKSYVELSKFIDYFNIKSSLTEKNVETYNRNIKSMLDDIERLKRENEGGVIYGRLLLLMHLVYGSFFIFLNQYIFVLLISYPVVWIVSWLLSMWKKNREVEIKKHKIEITYSRLLSKNVEQLIIDIFDVLVSKCKPK